MHESSEAASPGKWMVDLIPLRQLHMLRLGPDIHSRFSKIRSFMVPGCGLQTGWKGVQGHVGSIP
jgi:hypothetical protein